MFMDESFEDTLLYIILQIVHKATHHFRISGHLRQEYCEISKYEHSISLFCALIRIGLLRGRISRHDDSRLLN
jgi:hypothetical protein